MWQSIQKLKIDPSFHRKLVKVVLRKTHWPSNWLEIKIPLFLIFNSIKLSIFRRQAVSEIVRDSENASKLIEEFGPSSCHRAHPYHKANKRFLANTMRSVVNHNKRTTNKNASQSIRKFEDISKRKPRFGQRIHSFQRAEERNTAKKWLSITHFGRPKNTLHLE